MVIDPFNSARQYAYSNKQGELHLVSFTTDGWASQTPLAGEAGLWQAPIVDRATGGLFLVQDGTLNLWTPGARRVIRPAVSRFSVAGGETNQRRLVAVTPNDRSPQQTGIEVSSDGGLSWTHHEIPPHELPAGPQEYRFITPTGDPNDGNRIWVMDSVRHTKGTPPVSNYVHTLMRSDDGGAHWTACRSLAASQWNVDEVLIGADQVLYTRAGVYPETPAPPKPPAVSWRSDDGCKQWVPLNKSCRVLSVDAGSTRVYCVEDETGILWQSHDRGDTWRQVDGGNVAAQGIHIDSKQDPTAFVWGSAGLFRTADDGTSWTRLATGGPQSQIGRPFQDLTSVDGTLYVTTQDNRRVLLLRSQDSGESWVGVPRELAGRRAEPRLLLYDAVVTVEDTWRPLFSSGITVAAPKQGLGYQGAQVTQDFATTWRDFPTAIIDSGVSPIVPAPSDPAVIYTYADDGDNSRILVSRDAGLSWTPVPFNVCQLFRVVAVDQDDPNLLYVATHLCAAEGLYRVRSDGTRLERINLAGTPYVGQATRLVMVAERRVMLAMSESFFTGGPFPGLIGSRDGGRTWLQEVTTNGTQLGDFDNFWFPLVADRAAPNVIHAGANAYRFPP